MKPQQTIAAEIEISGQGLHTGAMAKMRILPQPANTGIYFGRSDLPGKPKIKADIHSVLDTKKCVAIGKDGWRISTIEHLMAAFHGLGIDNVLVEVDKEELPRGDCSGRFFCQQILKAGIVAQDQPRHYTYIREPFWVEGMVCKQGEPLRSTLIALPGEDFQISFTFTSDHKVTGTQYYHYSLTGDTFVSEIAPARTIAFMDEIDYLRSQGLALSDAYESVIVVDDDGYRNELRYPEEIVRHKILDLIGDLYLLGPLVGHIVAVRSGHTLDIELARKIAGQMKPLDNMLKFKEAHND
ncbi:MAG TPA: UDP-3-O-[3-hydroxymyristoyl] N-acetylglucosamine deacetylase [Firmicutes bacterium]|jgi:UDP-3-O-[3-hydroxymyristoyl] N-acetylglucosamine deacetylase|nr:UDP-3-O-[3-hydroxymyristoyl] N-acetylglucosamine deacetylase [Bacillota bacterium]